MSYSRFIKDMAIATTMSASVATVSAEAQTTPASQQETVATDHGDLGPGKRRRAERKATKLTPEEREKINVAIVKQGFRNKEEIVLGAETRDSKFLADYQAKVNQHPTYAGVPISIADPSEITASAPFIDPPTIARVIRANTGEEPAEHETRSITDSQRNEIYTKLMNKYNGPQSPEYFDLIAGGVPMMYYSEESTSKNYMVLRPSYDPPPTHDTEKVADTYTRLHETYHGFDTRRMDDEHIKAAREFPHIWTDDEIITDLSEITDRIRGGDSDTDLLKKVADGNDPKLPLSARAHPDLLRLVKERIDAIGLEKYRAMSDAENNAMLTEACGDFHRQKYLTSNLSTPEKEILLKRMCLAQSKEVFADIRSTGDMIGHHGQGIAFIDNTIAFRQNTGLTHTTAPALAALKQKILALDPDPEKAVEKFRNINNGVVDAHGQPVEGITAQEFYTPIIAEYSLTPRDIEKIAEIRQNTGRPVYGRAIEEDCTPATQRALQFAATLGPASEALKDDFTPDEKNAVRREMEDAAFAIGQSRSPKTGINMLTLREARDRLIDKYSAERDAQDDPAVTAALNRRMRLVDQTFSHSGRPGTDGVDFVAANARHGLTPKQTQKMGL